MFYGQKAAYLLMVFRKLQNVINCCYYVMHFLWFMLMQSFMAKVLALQKFEGSIFFLAL